jgi:hypothetical protein
MVLAGYSGSLFARGVLVLATYYYFHLFWKTPDDEKNMIDSYEEPRFSAMLFIIANGSGAGSFLTRGKKV